MTSQSKLCFLSLDQFANMHYPPQFRQYMLVALSSRNERDDWHWSSCDSILFIHVYIKITVRVNIHCPGNTFHATFRLVTCSNILHCIFLKYVMFSSSCVAEANRKVNYLYGYSSYFNRPNPLPHWQVSTTILIKLYFLLKCRSVHLWYICIFLTHRSLKFS